MRNTGGGKGRCRAPGLKLLECLKCIKNIHHAGQIVATSHDLGKGMPLFQQKSMLVKYYNLARSRECWCTHTMTQGVFSSPRLLERSLELCAVSWFQWAFEKKGNVSRANCLFPIAMMVVLLGSNKPVI